MPSLQNVAIFTYTEDDHNSNVDILPKQIKNLRILTRCGYGLKKVHEVVIPQCEAIQWKKKSEDSQYHEAKILVTCAPWTQRTTESDDNSSDG